MFDGRFRTGVDRVVGPVGTLMSRTGLRADHLTALGLVVAAAAAVAIATGHIFLGLVLVIAAALPDLLDGPLAKATGTSGRRGAFFDSTMDRVTDALLFGGLAWYLGDTRDFRYSVLAFAVFGAAAFISYARAKAESLGFEAKGGLMERAERVILLCVGLAFGAVLVPVLWVMLVLTAATGVQRFAKVWRQATAAQFGAAPAPASSAPATASSTPPAVTPAALRWEQRRAARQARRLARTPRRARRRRNTWR